LVHIAEYGIKDLCRFVVKELILMPVPVVVAVAAPQLARRRDRRIIWQRKLLTE
jgi:putative effector of murein hydrolase LrgA (UPF0299 family)